MHAPLLTRSRIAPTRAGNRSLPVGLSPSLSKSATQTLAGWTPTAATTFQLLNAVASQKYQMNVLSVWHIFSFSSEPSADVHPLRSPISPLPISRISPLTFRSGRLLEPTSFRVRLERQIRLHLLVPYRCPRNCACDDRLADLDQGHARPAVQPQGHSLLARPQCADPLLIDLWRRRR